MGQGRGVRTRYKFLWRGGNNYYWQATRLTDSRVEQISCNVVWFWTGRLPKPDDEDEASG